MNPKFFFAITLVCLLTFLSLEINNYRISRDWQQVPISSGQSSTGILDRLENLHTEEPHGSQQEKSVANLYANFSGKICHLDEPYMKVKKDRFTFILLNSFRLTNGLLEIQYFIEDDKKNDWDIIVPHAQAARLESNVSFHNISLNCTQYIGMDFHTFCQLPTSQLHSLISDTSVHLVTFSSISNQWHFSFSIDICFHEVKQKNNLTICTGPIFQLQHYPTKLVSQWIAYHKLLGVNKFQLYIRNESMLTFLPKVILIHGTVHTHAHTHHTLHTQPRTHQVCTYIHTYSGTAYDRHWNTCLMWGMHINMEP